MERQYEEKIGRAKRAWTCNGLAQKGFDQYSNGHAPKQPDTQNTI